MASRCGTETARCTTADDPRMGSPEEVERLVVFMSGSAALDPKPPSQRSPRLMPPLLRLRRRSLNKVLRMECRSTALSQGR